MKGPEKKNYLEQEEEKPSFWSRVCGLKSKVQSQKKQEDNLEEVNDLFQRENQ